ncbi:Unknown protein [Striga hermonthica]|uniref:Uncharacterized protein n=1 Tax=Striga hermonthica TaxID=68872 RepID=A0A9N7N3T5_STRHE|nr:Unknown protein [Striga hermonthica]
MKRSPSTFEHRKRMPYRERRITGMQWNCKGEACMGITSKERDMGPNYIRPSNFNLVPTWIHNNRHLYPYFKDCIDAIDRTIIPAWVPRGHQGAYRCRKGHVAQNVMVAGDFGLNFTFVWAGWEEKNETPAHFLQPDYVPQRHADDLTMPFMNILDTTMEGEEEQCAMSDRIATALWEDHVSRGR